MERYHIDRVIGKGAFGKAILCSRIADDKACIVKQVKISNMVSKDRRQAEREATVLAKLSHPNVVGFFESFLHGSSDDTLCIVMDYADGGDLMSVLNRRNGRLLDEDVVLDWFVQTTLALKHIHDRKILHRDLKPENIFLTSSGKVKLGDFGLAKVVENILDLTRTLVGTPDFLSPEICQAKRYNYKSDIWSLGCVLYEMLSLRPAFEGRDNRVLMMRICEHEPKPISSRYSAGTRALLPQLLEKEAQARPSTDVILQNPLINKRIRHFLTEEQIRLEFGRRKSPSVPGHPRSPSARGTTSRLTSKTNAVGRERSHHAEGARGRQTFRSGIVGLAIGARLGTGVGTGAGAARDEAFDQGHIIKASHQGGDAGYGERSGQQAVIPCGRRHSKRREDLRLFISRRREEMRRARQCPASAEKEPYMPVKISPPPDASSAHLKNKEKDIHKMFSKAVLVARDRAHAKVRALKAQQQKAAQRGEGVWHNAFDEESGTLSRGYSVVLNAEDENTGKGVLSVGFVNGRRHSKRREDLRLFISKRREEMRRAKQPDATEFQELNRSELFWGGFTRLYNYVRNVLGLVLGKGTFKSLWNPYGKACGVSESESSSVGSFTW